jgi:sugar/nucleoside kinase (ribokinase family)
MSLIVVGSVAYDGIETPHGSVDRILGGAATYIGLSASYFTDVSLVGVVGEDFAAEDREMLARHRIDLEGLEQAAGKTFFWKGVYSADMNDRRTLQTDLNVFADFNPRLPESYRSQPYLMLGNIQPALQRSVRAQMNGVRLAGGDTMNYWIADYRDELLATIREWDFLLINDSEARMLSGQHNLKRAAAAILDMGPNTLVIKRGEFGAILFRRDSHFMVPGYLLEEVFDPTGAGDCFAGGFVGYLTQQGYDLKAGHVDKKDLSRAVIYGSVMGSFCCERFGVDRFRTLTRENIDARFREFREFTEF